MQFIFFSFVFFVLPRAFFYFICTVSGCDGGNRTRNMQFMETLGETSRDAMWYGSSLKEPKPFFSSIFSRHGSNNNTPPTLHPPLNKTVIFIPHAPFKFSSPPLAYILPFTCHFPFSLSTVFHFILRFSPPPFFIFSPQMASWRGAVIYNIHIHLGKIRIR
jgi:hypothetical protein